MRCTPSGRRTSSSRKGGDSHQRHRPAVEVVPHVVDDRVVVAVDHPQRVEVGHLRYLPTPGAVRPAGRKLAGPGHGLALHRGSHGVPEPALVKRPGVPQLELDPPRLGRRLQHVHGLVDDSEGQALALHAGVLPTPATF
jgi:hypothetical protein